jgi:hypothetical protein
VAVGNMDRSLSATPLNVPGRQSDEKHVADAGPASRGSFGVGLLLAWLVVSVPFSLAFMGENRSLYLPEPVMLGMTWRLAPACTPLLTEQLSYDSHDRCEILLEGPGEVSSGHHDRQ